MRLIYFSPVLYKSYAQRPHYMVRNLLLSRIDRVLWLEPYPTRLPQLLDFRLGLGKRDAIQSSEKLETLLVSALPIEPLPGGAFLNQFLKWRNVRKRLRDFAGDGLCMIGVGRPSQLAVWALDNLPHSRSFFDAMDDFPAFYRGLSAMSMTRRELRVAAMVNEIYCSSHALLDKYRKYGTSAQLMLNGYNMTDLPDPLPPGSRKIIGYIGSIAQWFDWPLVLEIAEALPGVTVRLIGPEFIPRPSKLPANIEIWPECSQSDATQYVRQFAVGLIPFMRSHLTDCVDPIKYYEYRALGVPVWSTEFGEMKMRGERDAVFKIAPGTNWKLAYAGITEAMQMAVEGVPSVRLSFDWTKRFKPLLES